MMPTKSLARWFAALSAAMVWTAGTAFAADVRVMISAGFYGVYSELGPAFERTSGHRLVTTPGPSMGDSPESPLSTSHPARATPTERATACAGPPAPW